MFRKSLFLIVLVVGCQFAGCQIAGPDDPRSDELATQRAKWNDFQDGTYYFDVNRGCFCAAGGELRVQVINGKVDSAFSVWRESEVPADQLPFIETIEDMFDMIERAQDEAYKIEVEYSNHGFPSSISIDWIKDAVDDELSLTVSDVQVGVR